MNKFSCKQAVIGLALVVAGLISGAQPAVQAGLIHLGSSFESAS